MKIKGDTITFSSGRTRNANCGIIGLSPNLEITGGYDDGVWSKDEKENVEYGWMSKEDALSKDDLIDLADYMIAEWQRFKACAQSDAFPLIAS